MDSPAFTVLITTAGGTSSVDGYCTTLLSPSTSASESESSSTSAHPTHPTHATHPVHPSEPASSHTAERPTDIPSHSHPEPTHTPHQPSGTETPTAP